MGDQALSDFQREVANVFFALPESGGYLPRRPSAASSGTRALLDLATQIDPGHGPRNSPPERPLRTETSGHYLGVTVQGNSA